MDTASTAPARGGPRWRDLLGEHFVELDVHAEDLGHLAGTVESRTVGGLQLSRVRSVDQQVRRTAGLARTDARHYLQIGLVEDGQAHLQQDGRECWLEPGDFVLYETARPFCWELRAARTATDWSLLVFTWSSDLLALPAGSSQQLTARRLDGRAGITGVLGRMMRDLVASRDVAGAGVEVARELGRLVTSVAAASWEYAQPTPAGPGQRALLHAVREHIELHLGDPELDPGRIAAAHFISVRQLHRIFADQDETVARYIRRRRLERCREELLLAGSREVSLTAIAHRSGFPDPGVFGRAFRVAYGISPSQYRQRGPVQRLAPSRRAEGPAPPTPRTLGAGPDSGPETGSSFSPGRR
jgi:AraC-like DNA-binding protein